MFTAFFQKYQSFLNESSQGTGDALKSTILLLENTSELVKIFNSLEPIKQLDDLRLKKMRDVLHIFEEWEAKARENKTVKSALLSCQSREDLQCTILGFIELCKNHIPVYGTSIVPGRVNSDIVENTYVIIEIFM
jgi:hypothetical protein